MDLTTAAKTITKTIADYLPEYRALPGPGVSLDTMCAEVNQNIDAPLREDAIDELFALYSDAEEYDRIGVRSAHGPGNWRAERDAMNTTHTYAEELTRTLRAAGYDGDDFKADYFSELPTT